MNQRQKALISPWIKILLTIVLLSLAFYFTNPEEILNSIAFSDPAWILGAIGMMILAQVFASLRFYLILRLFLRSVPFIQTVAIFFIGNWFSQLLPTSMGGDAIRIVLLKHRIGFSRALRSSILNRFAGLLTLVTVPVLLWPWIYRTFQENELITRLVMICGIMLILTLAGVLYLKWIRTWKILSKIRPLLIPFLDLRRAMQSKFAWAILSTSCAIVVLVIGAFIMLSRAVGIETPFFPLFGLTSILVVSMHLPISYAGWGVREISSLALMPSIHVSASQSLAASVLYGAILFVSALPGFVFWHAASLRRDSWNAGQETIS
jgi:glycosyltransferase 2 family protein